MAKTHIYRTKAVEDARAAGYVAFRTHPNGEGMWRATYEPGENPADKYAEGNHDWVSHGEVAWVSSSAGDADPVKVGVLVCTCTYEELVKKGVLTIDRKLARIWLQPHDRADQPPFLAETPDGNHWDFFTPKVGAGWQPAPGATPVANGSGNSPAAAPRGAPMARSTADSPVKRVHAIADSMPGATRAQVVAACVEAGINKSTAGTQFYHWSKARKDAAE